MKKTIFRCLLLALLSPGIPETFVRSRATAAEPSTPPAVARRLETWREARFGMFIHWGPVALKGTEIGWSRGAQVPIEEYDALYRRFNPTAFDADAWMKTARDAGMKYVIFTTKHHDGFCMWDTKQTDFDIMHSPFGRDVTKELADAARRAGLAFGTYHSVCDWSHSDFPLTSPGGTVRRPSSNLDRYESYLRAQIRELVSNYGPLWALWFDVPQEFDTRRGQGLIDLARSIQPDLIVNNRSGAPGDYDTPEQQVGKFQMHRPWETCMTICQQWAWKPDDRMKSLEECLHTLVRCAGGDGNLLFNVGPMPDGRIEPRQVERLREMGAWLERHGASVYGTRGGPWKPTRSLASTRRDNSVYLHVLRWPDTPESGEIRLPPLPKRILRSSVLGGGTAATETVDGELRISVPPGDRRPIDTVVVLELDGPALEIEPITVTAGQAGKATASNTFMKMEEFGPEAAFDDDPHSRWATDAGTHRAWIATDLGKPVSVGGVRIREAYPGRVRRFEFQFKEGDSWKPILRGTTLGEEFRTNFPAVTAREVRLEILEATEGPTLYDLVILPDGTTKR
jgi:alpha-L-fucosidase